MTRRHWSDYASQIFFDDAINNLVLANPTYARTTPRDTTKSDDGIYNEVPNKELMPGGVTASGSGYAAAITIDASLLTATASTPAISAAGIVNAASGAAGLAPRLGQELRHKSRGCVIRRAKLRLSGRLSSHETAKRRCADPWEIDLPRLRERDAN